MTLQTEVSKIVYAGQIGETIFAYNFRVDDVGDMEVYLAGLLIDAGDWSIDGIGSDLGGNVTLNDPLAEDVSVTLLRVVPATQQVDYQPFDAFPSATHELALDRLTMMVQQLDEQVDRAYKAPVDSEPGEDFSFPPYLAGALIGWSETEENQLVNSDTSLQDIADEADRATAAANAADNSAELAADWAAEEENVPVEGQLFSARHYAIKALRAVGGLRLIAPLRGDNTCPKPNDANAPVACNAPDHRNPSELFDREPLGGDYYAIRTTGNMDLKDPDDMEGPETTQLVEIGDFVIFLPEILDGNLEIIVGEGWYRQGSLGGDGTDASNITFDDTLTEVKGATVQEWNENADAQIFENRLSGYGFNGFHVEYEDDLDLINRNATYSFVGNNVTNEPPDFAGASSGFVTNYVNNGGLAGQLQIVIGRNGANEGKQWQRTRTSGVWEDWVLVIDGAIALKKPHTDFLRTDDRLDIINVPEA